MLTNKKLVMLIFAMASMTSATTWAADESEDMREQLNILKDEILI